MGGPIQIKINLTGKGTSEIWSSISPLANLTKATHGFSSFFRVPEMIGTVIKLCHKYIYISILFWIQIIRLEYFTKYPKNEKNNEVNEFEYILKYEMDGLDIMWWIGK